GVDPRRLGVAENLHRPRLLEVATKAGGGNVGQVIGVGALRQAVVAGARHGDVQQLVHGFLRAVRAANQSVLRIEAITLPFPLKPPSSLISKEFLKKQRLPKEPCDRIPAMPCRTRQGIAPTLYRKLIR